MRILKNRIKQVWSAQVTWSTSSETEGNARIGGESSLVGEAFTRRALKHVDVLIVELIE